MYGSQWRAAMLVISYAVTAAAPALAAYKSSLTLHLNSTLRSMTPNVRLSLLMPRSLGT